MANNTNDEFLIIAMMLLEMGLDGHCIPEDKRLADDYDFFGAAHSFVQAGRGKGMEPSAKALELYAKVMASVALEEAMERE